MKAGPIPLCLSTEFFAPSTPRSYRNLASSAELILTRLGDAAICSNTQKRRRAPEAKNPVGHGLGFTLTAKQLSTWITSSYCYAIRLALAKFSRFAPRSPKRHSSIWVADKTSAIEPRSLPLSSLSDV